MPCVCMCNWFECWSLSMCDHYLTFSSISGGNTDEALNSNNVLNNFLLCEMGSKSYKWAVNL